MFVNGVLIGPFLPFLGIFVRDELGAGQAIAGNYRAITAIPMGFTGLFAAVASDRLGPKPSLVVGLLATAAAACVFLVASEWTLILLAVLHGAGHGLLTVGGETYLVRAARARQVGAASAAFFLGSTMGSAVGAAAGGAILDATSFVTLGRIMLGASLAMTVAALIWLPRIAPAQVGACEPVGNADRLRAHVAPRLHLAVHCHRTAAHHLLGDRVSGHAVRRRHADRLQRPGWLLRRTEPPSPEWWACSSPVPYPTGWDVSTSSSAS